MYPECRHVKPSGLRCKSPALRGMPFCYYHARLHRASNGPRPLKFPVLETSKDVQTALARVINDQKCSRPNPRQAKLYLRALQIALQTISSSQPVRKEGTKVSLVKPEQPANPNAPNRKPEARS